MLVGDGIGLEHVLQFTFQLLHAHSSHSISLATAFRELSLTAERPPGSGYSLLNTAKQQSHNSKFNS